MQVQSECVHWKKKLKKRIQVAICKSFKQFSTIIYPISLNSFIISSQLNLQLNFAIAKKKKQTNKQNFDFTKLDCAVRY